MNRCWIVSLSVILIGIAFLSGLLFAQDTVWTKTYGGVESDVGRSVRYTSTGYYITGHTSSFGAGWSDVYYIKTDPSGNLLWSKTYGGLGIDLGRAEAGNYLDNYPSYPISIVVGYTRPGAYNNVYMIKTDSLGDTLWTKTYGIAGSHCYGYSVLTYGDLMFPPQRYLITGATQLLVFYDIYLIQTNSSGDTLWTKTYGGSANEEAYSTIMIEELEATQWHKRYLITGYTNSFGAGANDVYLIKTDSIGDTLWTKTYGGTGNDEGRSIIKTSNGFLIAGYTNSFGAGGYDVYLVATNFSGDTLWTKTYGGIGDDKSYCVKKALGGGYIIIGSTTSFGVAANDVYIVRINAAGDTLWTRTVGGTGNDYGYSIDVIPNFGYIIVGSTTSFGAGTDDIYLIKIKENRPPTVMCFSPDTIIGPPPAPGDTFTDSICVCNVDSMRVWQAAVMFNPVLLQCDTVIEGPFLKQAGSTLWMSTTIDNNAGWINIFGAGLYGMVHAYGGGTLAYIKWQVVNRDSGGKSWLDLEDTRLLYGIASPLSYEIVNGCFLSQLPSPKDSSDTWYPKALMPTGRDYLAAANVNNKIYVLGGMGLGDDPGYGDILDVNEEYDLIGNIWTTRAPMLTARSQLAAAKVNDKIYAIGGYNFVSDELNTNEEYDPQTDTWTSKASMLTARRSLGAAAVNGKIYAIGGEANYPGYLSANEEYNPATDNWTSKATMPTARYRLAVIAYNDKIYAIGGYNSNGYLSTVEEYDPQTNTWTTKTPMPVARSNLSAAVVKDKIYVIGYDGLTYEYNPCADTTGGTPWVIKRGMPRDECGFAAVSISDRLYSFGGSWHWTGVCPFKRNFMYIPYSEIVGIEDNDQQFINDALELCVYPNPFSKKTEIRFSMLDAGYQITDVRLQIKIYDATGRLVKDFTQLLNYQLPNNQVVWCGDDDSGRKLPAGVYFVRFVPDPVGETGGEDFRQTEKVILLK
jgi:N-acetylneuraminic acid mutarotase